MPKITLVGAGSTVFARNLIGVELDLDQIWSLVDELIDAHGDWIPELV